MRKLVIILLGLAFLVPMIGCDESERRVHRSQTIRTQHSDTIVVPDAPKD